MSEKTILEFNFLPPTTNTYYRKFRNCMVISDRGRKFKEDIFIICKHLKLKKISGKVKIYCEFYFKGQRHSDIDNIAGKALFDSIKDILIEDDKMIFELHAKKFIGCKESKTLIEIKPLEE